MRNVKKSRNPINYFDGYIFFIIFAARVTNLIINFKLWRLKMI